MASNYPVYITPPKQIDITFEQFDNLSYMGVASFFCRWNMAVHFMEDNIIRVYLSDNLFWALRNNPQNEGKKMSYYESAEFGYADLKPGDKYYDYVKKKKNFHFKGEPEVTV